MNKTRLDLIDSVYLGFFSLKSDIEQKDNLKIENTIDGFQKTMQNCEELFEKDSELYKESQMIYTSILWGIQTKNYHKILEEHNPIESFLIKIKSEREKEIMG